MKNIINIVDNSTNRVITIDRVNNKIYAGNNAVSLGNNTLYALKINATNISTCNTEFLEYLLFNNDDIFNAVYHRITGVNAFNDVVTSMVNTTRSQFYVMFNNNNAINEFIEFFKSATHETRQTIISDHICYNHESKMSGIISLSTYVGNNKYCLARCKNCDNAICKYCYADSLTSQRIGLKNKLIRIHAILTNIELSIDDIPALDSTIYPYFRFESFGDINNTIQINNYNLIAMVNPGINFTIWTKNPGIVQKAIDNGMTISNNLIFGLSSLYLNKPEYTKAKKYPFIRFIFTVYDDNYISENNIHINCGARHCLSCGICYKHLHEQKEPKLIVINERKK